MPHGMRRPGLVAGAASAAVAVLWLAAVVRGPGAQRPASLFSWRELGASLDNTVPQRVNQGAADVGGVLVREHAPSGRLPGFGGGSHLFSDGVVELRRDVRHDLGFRRSARARAAAIVRREQRARSLERAREVLRRQREQERAGVKLQQMAQRRAARGPSVDPDGITEGTIEAAYQRAARLAAQHKAVTTTLRSAGSAGSAGSASIKMGVPSDDVEKAYRKAARLAKSAASAAAPRVPSAGAVGGKTAVVLSKAADALQQITGSLNSGTFVADPSRMAKMAQSLAALSKALGENQASKVAREQASVSAGVSAASAVQAHGARVAAKSDADGGAAARGDVRLARQAQEREQKIEEDILYHLDKLELQPSRPHTAGSPS